jgi:hypothetical protein
VHAEIFEIECRMLSGQHERGHKPAHRKRVRDRCQIDRFGLVPITSRMPGFSLPPSPAAALCRR